MSRENVPLLQRQSDSAILSLLLACLCFVDVFGVFPIIALPRTILLCGWLGIPLVLVVFGLQIYTASLLAKSWCTAVAIDPYLFSKNRYPLAAVTELALGRWASIVVSLLLDLSVFGGGIPNLLVASQNLQLFGLKASQQQFNFSYCHWILIVGALLCPIMWLGSPKETKWLVNSSTLAIFGTAFLVWWSIVTDVREINFSPIPPSSSWDSLIIGYGVLTYQFAIHPTLMTIQVSMKRPKDINKAIIHSYIVSGSLFAVTIGLLLLRYEGNTTANVLQSLPPTNAVQIAILIAALQLCLSSAMGHSALFEQLEDQLRIKRSFGWRRCAMRSAVVLLGVVASESMPRFDIVMSLIGGSLIGPLAFVLPPILYSRLRKLRGMGLRRSSAPSFLCCSSSNIDKVDCSDGQGSTTTNKPDSVIHQQPFVDPRIHSRSTHYGFRDGDPNKNDGYSFVYYDTDDDLELNYYTDYENSFDDDSNSTKRLNETISRSGSLPAMVDATRPPTRRPRQPYPKVHTNRPKRIITMTKLMTCFGYCLALAGVSMTVLSTFVNIQNTIKYIRIMPPCILNATIDITNWS
ncbi:hypothetical protein QAD02_012295 [Eretmocerus hayati]|uniref:Uncharacterized protein n=1 Tax=Eretmocerus hayati TaxID=131215 RepID=A0ACC2NZ80_9HYME|nr:hypothetical protein QAD02_012295 [Eretmocerus hayati]